MTEEFVFACGCVVEVGEHNVSFSNGHPSGVDYYYSEGGYNCKTSEEAAKKFHENFCCK